MRVHRASATIAAEKRLTHCGRSYAVEFYERDSQTTDAIARMSAGGITTMPSLRNCQALTTTPSRRSATNHKIVAREPVTERLGPRSTPIRMALETAGGTPVALTAEPAKRPAGKLFIKLEASATNG